MSLWGLIGWFFAFAIFAGLVLFAVAHMVVYGIFHEPSQDEDCGDDGGVPHEVCRRAAEKVTRERIRQTTPAPEISSGLPAESDQAIIEQRWPRRLGSIPNGSTTPTNWKKAR